MSFGLSRYLERPIRRMESSETSRTTTTMVAVLSSSDRATSTVAWPLSRAIADIPDLLFERGAAPTASA